MRPWLILIFIFATPFLAIYAALKHAESKYETCRKIQPPIALSNLEAKLGKFTKTSGNEKGELYTNDPSLLYIHIYSDRITARTTNGSTLVTKITCAEH
jgi:hypothetical protein